ncbi:MULTISPECIES: hypothetical protein [Pseudoalteromonas]|uniref:hypothetical protein n=1 Tax=Pseudoalteromonas TaxID=53246 RepID=UPI0018919A27|nr:MULTISPECIES: hypothetical protein [Pseudoalteromonas]MCG7560716.1 hypothetical protein [Pseudoalteromonas sp. McH1-42]MEC4090628.1 hypothetical protein [Pseudoalteromonas rubra]
MFNSAFQARVFTFAILCASPMCYASSQIDSMAIQGDIVQLELVNPAQSRTPAACVASEYQQHWTLSLNTASGKASYALLVNAFEQQKPVTIQGAGDCQDSPGIERIHSIRVQQKYSDDSVLYLYKGDGVTKLGRILKLEEGGQWEDLAVMIMPDEFSQNVKTVYPRRAFHKQDFVYYYRIHGCTGPKRINAVQDRVYFNENINDGRFFTVQLGQRTANESILRTETGQCTNIHDRNYIQYAYEYEIQPATTPLCGPAPCQIKP